MAFDPDWLVPDWPAPAHVHAVHTTRAGGVSLAPYGSLNLGDHVGDSAADVAQNRLRLARALGAEPVFMRQVHGTEVVRLGGPVPRFARAAGDVHVPVSTPTADACCTTVPAVACTIMVADCLPVLFTDRQGRAVAGAHAGWRGLAGVGQVDGAGVLERTVAALLAQLGSPGMAGDLLAWLGPCIGPQAFEVGDEVRSAFCVHDAQAAACFSPFGPGKWLADLSGLARQRLTAMGLTSLHGNDGSAAWCTVAQASRYFSHRRDRVSGRMAACIWLG